MGTASPPPLLTELAGRSADPAGVGTVLATLAEAAPDGLARVAEDDWAARALVALLAASRLLARQLVADPTALAVVCAPHHRAPLPDGADQLPAWKARELLRIAALDLSGAIGLEDVARKLAEMADDVLLGALGAADGPPSLLVVALGKLGGQELNYASDVDLLLVGDQASEPVARRFLELARRVLRVDLDLRPEGRLGPLLRSVEGFSAYWERWAEPWERQAMLKARCLPGPAELSQRFSAALEAWVWGRPVAAEELFAIRQMKRRAEEENARRGPGAREVKRGQGGIRDVEFSVQLLQLVHGHRDPALRERSTLGALAELGRAGYVSEADAEQLATSYAWLRTLEHRLQLAEGAQTHTIPSDRRRRHHLARVMGYEDSPACDALGAFEADLRHHQQQVRSIHERLFFRPFLDRLSRTAPAGTTIDQQAAAERLAAFGLPDEARLREALTELTRGLSRSSRLMQQTLPVALDWLSGSPDPAGGLLALRRLASAPQTRAALVSSWRESPEAARRLCLVVGTSRTVAEALVHQPELLAGLDDASVTRPPGLQELADNAARALSLFDEPSRRRGALLRFVRRETAASAIREILGTRASEETGPELSRIAAVAVQSALDEAHATVPLAVVALGRLGGEELSFGSDLDLLLVSAPGCDEGAALAAADRFVELLAGSTPAERIFAVDLSLRPEGRQGWPVRSLEAYRAYYQRWAKPWERQALLRARALAGDADLLEGFGALAREVAFGKPLADDERRELRRTKARVERERIPAGEDPEYHLKLGRGSLSDVEWTTQLLQLEHGVESPGTLRAVEALRGLGVLQAEEAEALCASWRFCSKVRDRLVLVAGTPRDSLPPPGTTLTSLARSLGMSPSELREHYRRLTRRARTVTEHRFFGMEGPLTRESARPTRRFGEPRRNGWSRHGPPGR